MGLPTILMDLMRIMIIVGETMINHPRMGMVNIPSMVKLWMAYYCFNHSNENFSHSLHLMKGLQFHIPRLPFSKDNECWPEIPIIGKPGLSSLRYVSLLFWHYIITMMFQCRAIILDHSCQWYIMKYTLLYNYIIIYIYLLNHIYMFMLMIFKDHIVPYSSATFFLGGNMAMIPAGMPGERSGHGVGWRRLASPMHTLVMYDPFILCYVIHIYIYT